MKILLINNYSMENAYSLWQQNKSGSHHLWGKVELEKRGKAEVIIFPHVKYKFLNKIGKFVGVGHLDQQVRVLAHLKEFDILYAPYATANTLMLLFLKWIGLLKKPMVATIHQPFLRARSSKKWLRNVSKKLLLQYDAAIFLSEELMKDTVQSLGIPTQVVTQKFSTAQWGPDTEFYKRWNGFSIPFNNCKYAISAGHTDRDFETLIEAFRHIDFPLCIYCTPSSIPQVEPLPDNVQVFPDTIPYFELLKYYQNAIAILVPLKYAPIKEGLQGMTSLQDVVALSKPVIMTRNKTLNLDVEKEGIGYWVDMYDIDGWKQTFTKLMHEEAKWHEMKHNAARVYAEKFNSDIFGQSLETAMVKVYERCILKQ